MDFEKEYSERFDWRRDRNIANLEKLGSIAHLSGSHVLHDFPELYSSRTSNNPIDALRWSILILWLQATECFILAYLSPAS